MRHQTNVLLGAFAIVGLLTACGGNTFADSDAKAKRRGADAGANSGDLNGADGSGTSNGNGSGADGSNANGKPGSGSGSAASDSIFGSGVGSASSGGAGNGGSGGSGSGGIGDGGSGGSGSGGIGNGGSGGSGSGGTGNGGSGGSGTGGTGNGGSGGNGTGGTGPGGGGGSGNTGSTNNNGGGGGSNNIPNNPLPTDCQPQKILILDFKSGWWAGDGGSTFSNLVKGEITTACPKGESSVEYHHILKTKTPSVFYNDASFGYTQVWVLSGSTADNLDIDPNHPGLLDVTAKIKAKKPRLFLGAGFGSIDHSNKVTMDVFGFNAFATGFKSDDILTIAHNGTNVSIINRATPFGQGNLFTGVGGSIPDAIRASGSGGTDAYSDELMSFNGLTVLSKCTMKSNVQASCIGVARIDSINIVFDSGLQRFYAAYVSGEEGVKQYLRNIVRALSL